MLPDLICFDCIMEQVNKGVPNTTAGVPIMVPFEELNDTGIYEVNCYKGHKSKAVIDNIDFEILFEYGINALADGYFREAVSSITSSIERYYEFFIKVILRASGIEFSMIDKIWKKISNQSERQLGAYVISYSQIFREEPLLLTDKDIAFRNAVIHKGKIPTKDEATSYGNLVMRIIEASLIKLKSKFPEQAMEVHGYYGYKRTAEEQIKEIEKETGTEHNFACVNIMTTIDVKHGREVNREDGRKGNIEQRISNILKRRNPRELILLKDEPKL